MGIIHRGGAENAEKGENVSQYTLCGLCVSVVKLYVDFFRLNLFLNAETAANDLADPN